ncbi:hypothetical protein XELAEV_18021908mg [Xenopus laevis]|uniref:C-type lectin domain-containing protein n=1 Tax=Xenopus laevis TaxID=8355 RepID=A0A974D1B7_XENLA|nr:hypothetical protein XELAEV_18021908mg [Xenopus laevis]
MKGSVMKAQNKPVGWPKTQPWPRWSKSPMPIGMAMSSARASDWIFEASIVYQPSYENANLACQEQGGKIATEEDIKLTSNRTVEPNNPAWYDFGVGFINTDGTFDPCDSASAFCYDKDRVDVVLQDNAETLKRLIIICILGSIFVILLIAALLMKGNQFICCLEKLPVVTRDDVGCIKYPETQWNLAPSYKVIGGTVTTTNANKLLKGTERRQSYFLPQMSQGSSPFYTNVAYDQSTDNDKYL